jgi:collagenase-like PrtC family protease
MNDRKRYFIVSGRQLQHQRRMYKSLEKQSAHLTHFQLENVVSVFGFVKDYSPLYGGRPYLKRKALSWQHLKNLSKNNVGFMLTLTNHYFDEDKYQQTIPILERLNQSINSIICTHDDLAKRVRKDFPELSIKASVIKNLQSNEEINKALEIYDFVTLHPRMNDKPEFLQSIEQKDKVLLFASIRCLYHCNKNGCFQYISDNMKEKPDRNSWYCQNDRRNRPELRKLTQFDLSDERYRDFQYFKFIL